MVSLSEYYGIIWHENTSVLFRSILSWSFSVVWVSALSLALLYLWVRPKSVDSHIPGPIRHKWFGIGFAPESELAPGVAFEWSRWPTIAAILSERWNYRTWGGPTLNVGFGGAFFNVVSPENLQYILRDNQKNYVKGKLAKSFTELMGRESAFSTDGALWAFHRKMAVAVLNKQAVTEGSGLIMEKLCFIATTWGERLEKERTMEVDFSTVASRITLDVFCQLGFGVNVQTVEEKNNEDSHAATFVQALEEIQYLIHLRFEDFFWEIKQKLGLGARERRIRQLNNVINEFARHVIDKAKKGQSSPAGNSETIIKRYLDYAQDQKHPSPTHQQLRDLVIGFVMAGRDSTAAALTWTLYELSRHPAVADRIRNEIESKIPSTDKMTFAEVKNLDSLQWAVVEALRLHPPAPESFRFAVHDDTLPDGTRIPAGSLVMSSSYTINHSRAVWRFPELFDPDRYSGKEPSPFQWTTFHGGSRSCPGRSLALMEIKMALAYLLPRFDFEDAGEHDGDYHWTIFMAMKGGFPVRIKQRNYWC